MNRLEISISSEVGNIVKVESFIETFTTRFGLSSKLFGKISLSVIEAVNNAILAGNKQDVNKQVTVTAEKEDDRVRVTVADEGEGFDYTRVPDPTDLNNLDKVTGRGLYLMRTLSDEIVFENNGATVTFVFNL